MTLSELVFLFESLGIDNYSVKLPNKEVYIFKEKDYLKLKNLTTAKTYENYIEIDSYKIYKKNEKADYVIGFQEEIE